MIAIPNILPQGQLVVLSISPTGTDPISGAPVPAKVDGNATWELTSGSDIVFLEVDENTEGFFTCRVRSLNTGNEGAYSVKVKVDADRGDGVIELSEEFAGLMVGVQADNIGAAVTIESDIN
jgi:hypothetical protein